MKTIVSVCSARPNFVKLAAVHHALMGSGISAKHVIVHTGQHYDPLFSDIFFEQLSIPTPDVNLGVKGGERAQVIRETEWACARAFDDIRPDIVLVYGDVNGAVGAANAAKRSKIPIGHVEAGLRSFDLTMPEEGNRIAVDRIADLLLCSEPSGVSNLKKERAPGAAQLVGNTMIDTLIRMQPQIEVAEIPADLPDTYAIVTLHRPSNTDDPAMLRLNVETLTELSERIPLLLPLHHRFRAALEREGLLADLDRAVTLLPALGYLPFLRLLSASRFILTDSGGVQEEATFLRKRCFTLRKNTERPITIESGSNILTDLQKLSDRQMLLSAADTKGQPRITVPVLWDGKAGERIVEVISSYLA
ncbi:MAG: UDP-N-acetylglucosamine 2-epimerase (non-hydrolyzing) [Candidatus Peribacteraceae bacterium]|jgi:UDP-N-acetylglucosamine 2-epimerase (non-hydrolysing)